MKSEDGAGRAGAGAVSGQGRGCRRKGIVRGAGERAAPGVSSGVSDGRTRSGRPCAGAGSAVSAPPVVGRQCWARRNRKSRVNGSRGTGRPSSPGAPSAAITPVGGALDTASGSPWSPGGRRRLEENGVIEGRDGGVQKPNRRPKLLLHTELLAGSFVVRGPGRTCFLVAVGCVE